MNKQPAIRSAGTSAVKSALRTLLIFELFADRQCPLPLAEVARALQVPKSSCLALLTTLAERGYLHRPGPDGDYYPTRRWLNQAQRVAGHDALSQQLHDSLVRLRDAIGETAILAMLAGDQSTYLDVVESTELVRFTARAGDVKPLNVSASGRAQLGALDEAARGAVLDRLFAAAGRPRVARRTLEKLIVEEHQRGWSINLGEYRADVISVAVGLNLGGGAHSLVIAAPYQRVRDRVDRIGRQIAREAQDLMRQLQ